MKKKKSFIKKKKKTKISDFIYMLYILEFQINNNDNK